MSEADEFESPRLAKPRAPAWELWLWGAILFVCTAPLQVLTDEGDRPGTFVLTSLAAVGAVALLLTRGRLEFAFRSAMRSWAFLLVVALMGAFALGGIDVRWSLVRWITWLPCVVVAFCVAARLPASQVVSAILAMLAAATILSVAVACAAPGLGVMEGAGLAAGEGSAGAWSGVYRTKNALGHTAGIAFALLLVFGRPALGRASTILGLTAAAACLVMARSASGVAMAGLLTMFCLLVLKARGGVRIAALGALAAAVTLLALGGEAATGPLAGLLGRDASLSGRTAIWRTAWPYAQQQPLIGSGYDYMGSPEAAGRLRAMFDVYSVHSGYLDALIALGFPLCALLAFAIASALRRAWREPAWPGEDRRPVATALLVGGLLSAVTEAQVTHPSGPMQMLWLLALFGLCAGA